MSTGLISILKKYDLNITKPRLLILDAFINAGQSLDQHYFLQQHKYKFDRATIFRTLRLFADKKIIYRVSVDGITRYIFQPDDKLNSHLSEHSSFVCMSCGVAIPVDTVTVPKLKIPKGFTGQNIEIIIRGICPACRS
ncbi:MAG TPA: transcriptional repressor [Puia sp.]|nr:transcriptional repressor [Puia sp.]